MASTARYLLYAEVPIRGNKEKLLWNSKAGKKDELSGDRFMSLYLRESQLNFIKKERRTFYWLRVLNARQTSPNLIKEKNNVPFSFPSLKTKTNKIQNFYQPLNPTGVSSSSLESGPPQQERRAIDRSGEAMDGRVLIRGKKMKLRRWNPRV
jgi:hypothetical protein